MMDTSVNTGSVRFQRPRERRSNHFGDLLTLGKRDRFIDSDFTKMIYL